LDGQVANATAIDPNTGTLESGLAINIGQDGTGTYTDGNSVKVQSGMIDDVAIWRRALVAPEIRDIYSLGLAGKSFDVVAPAPKLSAERQGNKVTLLWPASAAGFGLESTPTLSSPSWSSVAGATVVGDQVVVTITAEGAQRYFRLKK
jgi:hypothetical protein